MRGWVFSCLIVWVVTRKTNADISSQSLTASPRVSGIPPLPVICSWASCKGLCQSEITEDSLSCSDILLPFAYEESRCPTQQDRSNYKVCIGPASGSQISRCKLKGTHLCFPQYHDTVTNRNHTEICRNTKSCQDLSQLCLSMGYTNCSSNGYTTSTTATTSNLPTTMSRDLSTRNQPVRTPDDLTSERNVSSSFNPPITTNASSMNPPITDDLDSLISLVFMIGIVIGVLFISLILVVIFLLCVIRKYRRKKFGVPKQGENFEMNEGAVYHAIGPELPPNHPTLGKGGNPSNPVNTSGSSCSLEVTMETTQAEAENLQGNQNEPYYVLESTDEQYQEGINRDISRKTGSNYINASNTPYVDNQVYNSGFPKAGDHGKNGPDITREYTQLQTNGKEYSQATYVTENEYETSTHDNSISDRPYMALHATDVDSGDVTASEKETDSSESLLHSRKNSVDDVIESRDFTKGAEGPEVKKDKKLNDPDVLQDPTYDAKRMSEKECGAEVNQMGRQMKTIEDKGSEPNESPSCNYQQGSTTFPRPKSFKVPSSGSATPKKSKFLSLRFGSKKRSKLSKKKLKSFCSADVSDFCLDLNISSPTSPAEERDDSFFTAAVPIIHAPPQEPKVVPEKLSKSQEAIFDDVTNEPFRNRSLSQPIRKTFSPTLCKEYEEIKESWGATYLQVPSHDQK